MAQQGFEDDLLQRWFPVNAEETLAPFTENDIRGIADVLTRCGRERWSLVPRLYSILRKIDQLDTIDAFIDSDITDVYFPFTKSTLPEALRDLSARLRFLELQHLVYNKEALSLERHAPHGHFSDYTEVPLKKVGELGKGGFGFVDHVVSTISHQQYARKLIPRGKTFKKDKQVLKDFTKELSNLKQLSHKHLVELVGSYTDNRYVALVMLPVADTNLQTFLERAHLDEGSRSYLRPFFGCLTSALCYLHDNRIRHKDIKPSNILIKGDQVYFTDFGTALDWSDRGSSITLTAAPTTPRYCAPEVIAYTERSSSSDIWSFGCVFLEMWTVLRCHTLEDLRTHMTANGSGAKEYHSNLEANTSWIEILRCSPGPPSDLIPSTWIKNMLQRKPADRWNIHTLDNNIGETCVDSSVQHMFKGLCCQENEDDLSGDSWFSSEESEDQSIAPLQAQHTSESTTTKASSEVPDPGQDVTTMPPEEKRSSTFLGRTDHLAETDSSSLVDERAARFENTSGNSINNVFLERDERSAPELAFPYFDASIWEPESGLETEIEHDILLSSSLVDDAGAIMDYSNVSSTLACHWDVAFEPREDDVTDDETSNLPDATGKLATHALVPQKLSSYQDKAAINFEEHARACFSCKDPLEVFRRHGKLCVEGFRLAKRLLAFVSRSNGRVYGVRMISEQTDHVSRCILEVVYIPSSYDQVKGLLKAIERSKRCSGNYVFLARYCEDLEHRYWQELYPCPWCKRPLGSETRKLVDNGELVHKSCRPFYHLTGDGSSEDKREAHDYRRPAPRYTAPDPKQNSARKSSSRDAAESELPKTKPHQVRGRARDFDDFLPFLVEENSMRLSSIERRVLKKKQSSAESWVDTSDPPVKHKPAKTESKKSVFGNYMDRVLQRSR